MSSATLSERVFEDFLPSKRQIKMAFPSFHRLSLHLHDQFIPHERNNYHPHVLSHRSLGFLTLLMVTVKIVSVVALTISPTTSALSSAITPTNIINLTNQSRAESGLAILSQSSLLERAAQNKANDMLAKGYFSHNSPDGKTPWSFIKATGYQYLSAGENLAVDFTQAESVNTAWLNSPGHRANLMNKSYTEIGVGIASGQWQGHYTTFVVQMFGAPIAQKVELAESPTPVASAPAQTQLPTQVQTQATAKAQTQTTLAEAKPPVTPHATVPVQAPIEPDPIVATADVEQAQLAGDNQLVDMKIADVQTSLRGNDLQVQVATVGEAEKVFAQYGDKSIRLYPNGQQTWVGDIPLTSLPSNSPIRVIASNLNQSDLKNVGATTPSLTQSYGSQSGEVKSAIDFFGITIDTKQFEQKFYLFMVATVIASLILAIGIKRHVQHLTLVANGSFAVILAVLLWVAG